MGCITVCSSLVTLYYSTSYFKPVPTSELATSSVNINEQPVCFSCMENLTENMKVRRGKKKEKGKPISLETPWTDIYNSMWASGHAVERNAASSETFSKKKRNIWPYCVRNLTYSILGSILMKTILHSRSCGYFTYQHASANSFLLAWYFLSVTQ